MAKIAHDGHTSQVAVVEAMRRLHGAIQAQTNSADTLGKRIARMNIWLLVFTIAIFALTAMLVWRELIP